jgi:Holliday junction DNA helicase RuvA
MIARIYGTIEGFSNRGVYVRVGGIVCEVLLTGGEKREIERRPLGEEIALFTMFILEGKAGGSSLTPILIGFQKLRDREFFELFISVEGIGIGSALKMLVVPIPQIAQAIEDNNLTFLCSLKQVGQRTARKIVASLMGKVGRYAAAELNPAEEGTGDDQSSAAIAAGGQTADAETLNRREAIQTATTEPSSEQLKTQAAEILEQLGYSSYEVKKMLAKVFYKQKHFNRVEDILTEIYRGDLPAPR